MNRKQPDLDDIINDIYESTLKKFKDVKTAYSLFTSYRNIETD